MLVHIALFWLKKDLDDKERTEFREGLESLKAIKDAEGLYIGRPVPSERPVVDGSYDFALTVLFKDKAAMEAYQVHPIHKAFGEKNRPRWQRLQVYDAQ